jgi:anti-sigma factor RsiW
VELTDAIMVSVDEQGLLLSRLFDGELSVEERKTLAPALESDVAALSALNQHATLGRLIREAVDEQSRRVELSGVWAAVAPVIGMADPEEVPGWEPVRVALVAALQEHGALSDESQAAMAASIMGEVEAHVAHMSRATQTAKPASRRWLRWAVPTFAVAAAAAAMLFTPIIGDGVDGQGAEEVHIEYAERNDTQIEDLEYADNVFVHIIAPEDGSGPLIIMIDEDAGPLQIEEDDGVWDTGMEPI